MDRTPISVALPLANKVVAQLLALPGVSHASYCGSLRRFSETVGDVDIVVAASGAEPVMDALVAMSFVDRVLVRGPAKTSVVTRRGTQVDVRIVAAHQLGAARLYFTGSKGHNIKLRQRALARGLTLNEYALSESEGGAVVASETEEAIYAGAGPALHPARAARGRRRDRGRRGRPPAPPAARGDRRLSPAHDRLGRWPLLAGGGGGRRPGPRLPGPGRHRPRRGDPVGREPRGDARSARPDPGAGPRAGRHRSPSCTGSS